ncbi:MAG: hypothetical protein V1662_00690 [Candidatus Omnitrophota bacterium]
MGIKVILGLCIFFGLGAGAQAAEVVSITELVSHTQKYDGRTVVIQGEVIGDIINGRANSVGKSVSPKDRDYVWLNICEQKNIAIGVLCPNQLAQKIKYKGCYNFTGDQVLVQGVFHRACPAHNSEVDIHAENIAVVGRGSAAVHPVDPRRLILSKNLASLAIVLAIMHLVYHRQQQRKKSRL